MRNQISRCYYCHLGDSSWEEPEKAEKCFSYWFDINSSV